MPPREGAQAGAMPPNPAGARLRSHTRNSPRTRGVIAPLTASQVVDLARSSQRTVLLIKRGAPLMRRGARAMRSRPRAMRRGARAMESGARSSSGEEARRALTSPPLEHGQAEHGLTLPPADPAPAGGDRPPAIPRRAGPRSLESRSPSLWPVDAMPGPRSEEKAADHDQSDPQPDGDAQRNHLHPRWRRLRSVVITPPQKRHGRRVGRTGAPSAPLRGGTCVY